jgi:hypothetical protein
MKRWAVAYMNYYENDLSIEIVRANDWASAISKHSVLNCGNMADNLKSTLEDTKQRFFDCDSMVDVIEIPKDTGFDFDP